MTIKHSDRAFAEQLLIERRELTAQARIDHQDGYHVGTNAEVTRCADCDFDGDMPRLGIWNPDNPTRGQYLARNISETVARMQLHADIAELEHPDRMLSER